MLTLNNTHTHTHINGILFSVSRVHIHSCATTLDKEGRLLSGVAAGRGGGKDRRVDGWLAEGAEKKGGGGQTSTSTELQTR